MTKIIQFDPNKIRARGGFENFEPNPMQKSSYKAIKQDLEDSFSYDDPDFDEEKEQSAYSIQEVVQLVGEKKTDEIFATYLAKSDNEITGTISPPTGDIPLKESLGTIWGKNKESAQTKAQKLSKLRKTKRAFLMLEKEASKKLREKTGTEKGIKITVKTEDEEAYLTDVLEEQIEFYRKGKLGATISLLGQRINHNFGKFVDKMTSDD